MCEPHTAHIKYSIHKKAGDISPAICTDKLFPPSPQRGGIISFLILSRHGKNFRPVPESQISPINAGKDVTVCRQRLRKNDINLFSVSIGTLLNGADNPCILMHGFETGHNFVLVFSTHDKGIPNATVENL